MNEFGCKFDIITEGQKNDHGYCCIYKCPHYDDNHTDDTYITLQLSCEWGADTIQYDTCVFCLEKYYIWARQNINMDQLVCWKIYINKYRKWFPNEISRSLKMVDRIVRMIIINSHPDFIGYATKYNAECVYPIDFGITLKKLIGEGLTNNMIALYGIDFWNIIEYLNFIDEPEKHDKNGRNILHHYVLSNRFKDKPDIAQELLEKTLLPDQFIKLIHEKDIFDKTPLEYPNSYILENIMISKL